jgi:uncharacterized membrane protein YhaH (DUF805 family)
MVRSPWGWMRLALSRFADFRGRSSRPEFLWSLIGLLGLWYISRTISSFVSVAPSPFIALLFRAVIEVPALAVLVRRLHDLNLSGWWAIPPILLLGPVAFMVADVQIFQSPTPMEVLSFGPMICVATLPVVMVLSLFWTGRQGVSGPNRYGSEPS